MALIDTDYQYIVLNEDQVALIEGTTMKVVELVLAQRAYGWDAVQLQVNTWANLFRLSFLLGSSS